VISRLIGVGLKVVWRRERQSERVRGWVRRIGKIVLVLLWVKGWCIEILYGRPPIPLRMRHLATSLVMVGGK
jgi:hypothetical protein